jgi:hypothetical protein
MSKISEKKGVLILGMLIIAGLALFLSRVATEQQKYTLYNPDSYGPDGFKAIYLLLAKNQYRPVPLDSFRDRLAPVLVVYTAARIPDSVKRPIVNWVKSGGILVELAQSIPRFSSDYRLFSGMAEHKIPASDPRFSGLTYTVQNGQLYGIAPPAQGLFRLRQTGIITRQLSGKGTLLSWTDPRGLSNRSLQATPDNGIIFILWLKTAYPYGILNFLDLRYVKADRTTGSGEFPAGLFSRYGVAVLFLLIGAGLTLWKTAARFGRPRPLQIVRGRSYDEFVTFLARLFQRANAQYFAITRLGNALITVIAHLTGLPPDTPFPILLERLRAVTRRDYPRLAEIGRLLQQPSLHLTKREFLAVAISLDTCRKELLEWKKSTSDSI